MRMTRGGNRSVVIMQILFNTMPLSQETHTATSTSTEVGDVAQQEGDFVSPELAAITTLVIVLRAMPVANILWGMVCGALSDRYT